MKRISLAVVVLALLCLGWTFVPRALTASALPPFSLPPASPPAEMSFTTLPTADLGSKAALAFRGGSFSDERTFSQTALLVHHPKGDLLFDTGLGKDAGAHFERTSFLMRTFAKLDLHQPAAQQLRKGGYDLAKLAGIVPTHAHWDHISGVPDFPGVPLWMNDSERAFVASGERNSELLRSFGAVSEHRYAFTDGPYLGFARSLDVWGDGSIVLVPAPGHSPGSILVFLTLPSGRRLLLLGDLVWQTDGIEQLAERPWLSRRLVDSDPEQVRSAIAHVAALHQRLPPLELLPAHDARAWSKLPVFPATAR